MWPFKKKSMWIPPIPHHVPGKVEVSPLPETDYDGNDLWALRLPPEKPYDDLLSLTIKALVSNNYIGCSRTMFGPKQFNRGLLGQAGNLGLGL